MKLALLGTLAFCTNLIGIGTTITTLVLMMAGSPNSSDGQLSRIKWAMLAIAVVGLVSVAGSIWALIAGRPGAAAAMGIVPAVFCAGVLAAFTRIAG